ncbi:MAG: hypothetical protein ACLT98_06410 [Eggerthellaceae bacterium]
MLRLFSPKYALLENVDRLLKSPRIAAVAAISPSCWRA